MWMLIWAKMKREKRLSLGSVPTYIMSALHQPSRSLTLGCYLWTAPNWLPIGIRCLQSAIECVLCHSSNGKANFFGLRNRFACVESIAASNVRWQAVEIRNADVLFQFCGKREPRSHVRHWFFAASVSSSGRTAPFDVQIDSIIG